MEMLSVMAPVVYVCLFVCNVLAVYCAYELGARVQCTHFGHYHLFFMGVSLRLFR